jgi:hypothetical protein
MGEMNATERIATNTGVIGRELVLGRVRIVLPVEGRPAGLLLTVR